LVYNQPELTFANSPKLAINLSLTLLQLPEICPKPIEGYAIAFRLQVVNSAG